jgi:cytoskeletal protein CcmA (bactofilin family)
LVVVGQTNIEGKAFLPKQAVKRGTIAGNAYTGSQLINGTIELSKNTLPNLENRKNIQALCNGFYQFQENTLIDLQEYATMVNSFEKPTQIFKSNSAIDLKNINLTGNIVIQSGILIRIHASATLKDVIIMAPNIEILDQVEGNFQAFASKEIQVGKNCKLSYPSALVIYEPKEVRQQIYNSTDNQNLNQLVIADSSEIKGVVGFLSDNESNNYKPQLSISESAVVIGEVFCDRNLQLMGTVKGSVYTKNFITLAYGSVYQNHLYNGKILSSELAEQYSGLMLEMDTKGIAKWLY